MYPTLTEWQDYSYLMEQDPSSASKQPAPSAPPEQPFDDSSKRYYSTSAASTKHPKRPPIGIIQWCASCIIGKHMIEWIAGNTDTRIAAINQKLKSKRSEIAALKIERDIAIQKNTSSHLQVLSATSKIAQQSLDQGHVSLSVQQELNQSLLQNITEIQVRTATEKQYIDRLEKQNQELIKLISLLQNENKEIHEQLTILQKTCIEKDALLQKLEQEEV